MCCIFKKIVNQKKKLLTINKKVNRKNKLDEVVVLNKIGSNVLQDFVNETKVEEKIIEKKIEENVIIDPEIFNNFIENNDVREFVLKDVECF